MSWIMFASNRRRACILILAIMLVFVAIFNLMKSSASFDNTTESSRMVENFDVPTHNKGTAPLTVGENTQARHTERTLEIRSSATSRPERFTMAADRQHQQEFDAEKVLKLFCSCRGEDNLIFIDCYIDAYEELCKIFRLFGSIFSFVTSDVEQKIGILRDYNKGENSQHYKTVQSMLQFEVLHELTDNKKKPSGSRTLLRLHRAMEFISAFLVKLKDSENSVKFSSATGEAYDTTLAKHHPWIIRKAVQVALYMLPTRLELLKKMGVEDSQKGMQGMGNLVSELVVIFDVIEKLYAKEELLDLL